MLHQVGVGALGPVFRTYEPTRDRLVAVKVFRLDITPEQAQALADELAVAAEAGLFHPSIVEPIAAGVEGTSAYRAEEYVAAESLDIAVRHYAPATVEKVLPFVTQMAGAIDFARTAGVGHGALHPRDVFVTPEEARITGFGVVEALQRVGIRAPVRRPYSAPERVAGEAWSTPADVFSLAAITYELMTARRPSGVGADIGSEGLTAPVHNVLAHALDENPATRFSTALAFASALEAAGRGETVIAAKSPRQSRPSKVASAAAAAAAGAAASAANRVDPDAVVEQQPGRQDVDERLDPVAAEQEEDAFRLQEPGFDDIQGERDDDEAHLALMREEHERADAAAASQPGSLFEGADDEALEDLALDAHARAETDRLADEFMVASADQPFVEPSAPSAQPSAIDHLREEMRAREARAERVREAREQAERVDDTPRLHATHRPDDSPLYGGGAHEPYVPPPAAHDRRSQPMYAIAVIAVLGLLVGFLAGRAVGIREGLRQAAEAAAAPSGNPAATPYSEQPVAPQQKPSEPPPVRGEAAPQGVSTPSAPTTPPTTASKPAAPRPTTGRVTVTSTPRGASVTIDKQWRGRTPLTVSDLPLGTHELRVVQEGYVVNRQDVTLSEETPNRTVSVRLKRDSAAPARGAADTRKPAAAKPVAPESFVGEIYVDSRPRGARVFLDGKMVGVTPLRIPDVSIGSHVIRLQLEAHRDWTTSTRVVAGVEQRVTGSLDPIR